MTMLKCWAGGAFALLTLTGGACAATMLSRSNDPVGDLSSHLTALLGQENAGLDAVPAETMAALATPPADLVAPVGAPVGPTATAVLPVTAPTWDDVWLAAQVLPKPDAQFTCLATALYFEARGESIRGQTAVAEVILNRTELPQYPRTVCGVVNQAGAGGCQFSYVCDGQSDAIREPAAWDRARRVAAAMLGGAPRLLTSGATHFHTPAVHPTWSRRFAYTGTIGAHLFYRQPVRTALN